MSEKPKNTFGISPQEELLAVSFTKEGFVLRDSEETHLKLPKRVGEAIRMANELSNHQINFRNTPLSPSLSNNFTERILQSFDCHTFVAYACGLLNNLEWPYKYPSYTANHKFFQDKDYVEEMSFEKIKQKIIDCPGNILLAQQLQEGQLKHSLIIIKMGVNIYLAYKAGKPGMQFLTRFNEEEFVKLTSKYGNQIAFDNYENISSRSDLITHYSAPHFSN